MIELKKAPKVPKNKFLVDFSFTGFAFAVAHLLVWEFYIYQAGGWTADLRRGDFVVPSLLDFPVSFVVGSFYLDGNNAYYAVIFFGTILWYFIGRFLGRLVDG